MRIAVLAPPWAPVPPLLYGGTELVVDRMATGYQAAGHDVTLFTTGDSTCSVSRWHTLEQSQGWRIGATVPELIHVTDAYEEIVAQGFDVVHDHSMFGPFYSERFPNLPIATTVHGPLDGELGQVYERLDERVRVVAISEAQRRPRPDIKIARVIHHGIDTESFPLGDGGGDYFLFLGRMSPDKGAHRAMEAAFKAGVPLVMAAKMREPDEIAYFETFVKPYLNNSLIYLGEVPHAQKLDLLANARALLFPIRWNEPFGMVMIEALACGTPVLAFPEGAAPEVIRHGKTGFLCHDEADMAEAIGRVGTIDRLECRAEVEGYFSATRMVNEYLDLFQDMLNRS
jgi:glycosyltransferase involved in cell wall biosynthesis